MEILSNITAMFGEIGWSGGLLWIVSAITLVFAWEVVKKHYGKARLKYGDKFLYWFAGAERIMEQLYKLFPELTKHKAIAILTYVIDLCKTAEDVYQADKNQDVEKSRKLKRQFVIDNLGIFWGDDSITPENERIIDELINWALKITGLLGKK